MLKPVVALGFRSLSSLGKVVEMVAGTASGEVVAVWKTAATETVGFGSESSPATALTTGLRAGLETELQKTVPPDY